MNDEKIFEEDEKVVVKKRYDIPYVNLRLDVPIGATVHSIYIQYGFISNNYVNSLHTHTHSEVHVFLGSATFYCDDNVYELEGGTIILVPRGVYHNFDMADATLHSAFQINMEAPFHLHKVSKELLCEYFQKLDGCVDLSEFSRIVPYISFFCSYLFPQSEKVEPKKINDYGFLINEFFSLRYTSQIDISDLAKTLCVSEKQAHRLVIKHMGNTFGAELTKRRMLAAEKLIKDGRLPLSKIALAVGYQTYAGFWKAYKKHLVEKENKKNEQ